MGYDKNVIHCMSTLKSSLSEWVYVQRATGSRASSPFKSESDCELCGKADLKERHAVENVIDKTYMMVGSECVRRFDLSKGKSAVDIKKEQDETNLGVYLSMGGHILDFYRKYHHECYHKDEYHIVCFIIEMRKRKRLKPDEKQRLIKGVKSFLSLDFD